MARLQDYLIEVRLGKNPEVDKVFNLALEQVYSNSFLGKINDILTKRIKVKEKVMNNPNAVAWNKGSTIYVNKPVFYSKPINDQIRYLLHEFAHVIHHSKGFLFLKKFKEMKTLSNNLWEIIDKHANDKGKFLTGKPMDKKYLNKEETVSYLMNDSIDWKQISPEGKQLFINELKKSGMFNLQHPFWKKRLSWQ